MIHKLRSTNYSQNKTHKNDSQTETFKYYSQIETHKNDSQNKLNPQKWFINWDPQKGFTK